MRGKGKLLEGSGDGRQEATGGTRTDAERSMGRWRSWKKRGKGRTKDCGKEEVERREGREGTEREKVLGEAKREEEEGKGGSEKKEEGRGEGERGIGMEEARSGRKGRSKGRE